MGSSLTVFQQQQQQQPEEKRVFMNGLDGAGKTTILYRWKQSEVITTIPTIGFNVEEIKLSSNKTKLL